MEQDVQANKLTTIELTVIRCGCPKNMLYKHKLERHGVDPETGAIGPCPTPRKVRNLGVVSYDHQGHPIETALMNAWIAIRRRFINDK